MDELRVLVVEDSEDDALLLERYLRNTWPNVSVARCDSEPLFAEHLSSGTWDVVLSDYHLPSFTALDVLRVLRESSLDIPLLVVSGTLDEERAVEVLRAGARDFLSKGRWARLAPAIDRERQEAQIRQARRHSERELSEALERSAFAQDAAGVGTWEYHLVRGTTTWSPVFETLHGLPPGTFDGTESAFVPLVHPDDCTRVLEHCHSLGTKKGDHQITYRVIWPDRTTHWVTLRGRTFADETGQIVRAAGIGLDVTAQVELEESVRQAHKMESVGNLAGGIAHDFNNLLTVITGYAELLSEQFADTPGPLADVGEILRASRSATVMTRQLLAFSRRQVLQPKVVSLNDTVTDLKTMLHRLIESNIELVFALSTGVTKVRVDPGQIEQVVLNLVVNARDAMPTGGTLTVSTDLVETGACGDLPLKPGPHVRLVVRDTGVGMTAAVQQRVFEPFFTTKDQGRGTGLGLATVYGIVQQSGGGISVNSQLGKGTAFCVCLPACEDDEIALNDAAVNTEGRVPREFVMLIVEDDSALRTFAERAVHEMGGDAIAAATAEDAQRNVNNHDGTIDVALIDIMMPGMGGAALGDWLRIHSPSTEIIFTSGYAQDALKGRGLGASDTFLSKPFTKSSLQALLQRFIRG